MNVLRLVAEWLAVVVAVDHPTKWRIIMRKILTLGVALTLAGFGLSSCTESDQPTELSAPEIGGPSFAQGGQGQGAQFVDNPFIGASNTDPDGDFCLALLDPPVDDINDFIRTNPNGASFIHWSEHGASITFVTAGGDLFQGTGTFTLNSGFAFPGTLLDPLRTTASGKVTDAGGVTKQALCRFMSSANGNILVDENALLGDGDNDA